MSYIGNYSRTVAVELGDGTTVNFARMGGRRWAKLAKQLRDDAVAVEMRALDASYKAMPAKTPEERTQAERVRQDLRMRAAAFAPSYFAMIDHAQSAEGMPDVLAFAAIEAGTDKDLAAELPDILSPAQVASVITEIVNAPLGPKVGGDVTEGQTPNPTSAESSSPATGTNEPSPGSESLPSPSIGEPSPSPSDATTAA